ncbi:unnamed protein product [Ectocarpus sp. CCAP 1310/34]|nr:unnamed protein product [Ectocarpus sp. CCAP 1310/34]
MASCLRYRPDERLALLLSATPRVIDDGACYRNTASCSRIRNRYTNAGDTVLGIGVETTTAPVDAISRGRRVEFYVMDESKRAALQTNIASAFHKAHSSGMFQVDWK